LRGRIGPPSELLRSKCYKSATLLYRGKSTENPIPGKKRCAEFSDDDVIAKIIIRKTN